jgi:superoxide dismutase, Cu-Zn family
MKSLFSFPRISAAMLLILTASLFSCSSTRTPSAKQAKGVIAATGTASPGNGTITFQQQEGKVLMNVSISFPSKAGQTVAVHLHEHGDCGNSGNDAHGHWNPTNEPHGRWGSGPHHLGDIGNITLNQSGNGALQIITEKWSIGTGASNDIVGRAVIVHSGADDYVTQPTGNAGSRIGCGVIELVK